MSATARPEIPAGLAPGSELPRSRQTMRWTARPVRFMQSLQERHGDVFTMHLLREPPWVMVSDPELVKRVFTAPADVLHAGEPRLILEPILGPESVILNDGERHMRQRKLLLPPFHGERVSRYEETMRSIAAAEIDRWPRGTPAPAAPRMGTIALEITVRTVFGVTEGEMLEELREALAQLMEHLSANARAVLVALADTARLGSERYAEFRRLLERADEAIFAAIARRRGAARLEERDDVLSLLLQARHDDGSPMSDRELRDELMSLLVAGHETTATSLAWALERLARHPRAMRRAAAEAPGGGPYTDAVIQETLRLRPVFMHIARRVRQPFQLGDYLLPVGVNATIGIPLVHRRPDVYPDPDAFRPERFLERPPGTYTWIPFGGGVRRCLGAAFTMVEMRAVLSTLLARATVRAGRDEPEAASRRLLVMAPARGAPVTLEPR